MAKIPNKKNTKGAPPVAEQAMNNLGQSELGKTKTLSFKVDSEFHKEFKRFALDYNMSMMELLKESFELMKETKR